MTHFLIPALLALGLNTLASLTGWMNPACAAVLAGWAAYSAWQYRPARRDEYAFCRVLLGAGFAMGLVFVLRLGYLFSWHDLADYSADFSRYGNRPDGHLGFIAWMVENGRLPLELNPLSEGHSVFYNPPFYHMVQAVFMKLNLLVLPQSAALENLQIVTFLCAFGTLYTTYQILRELGFSPRAVRTGLWMMCFQPMLHILGATLNNDMLMVFLAVRCCLFTVRWYRSRSLRDIVRIGVYLGLGMATKLNCALLIPCIAFVFIYAFFREAPGRRLGYVGPFAAFLAVSVPEAVAWPVHNLIAFGLPLNYVRLPSEAIKVADYSLWARFGIPDWFARRGIFFTGLRKYNHNVWMQTLSTGLFDELTLFEDGTLMWYVCYLLLAAFAGLLVLGFGAALFKAFSRRDRVEKPVMAFLLSYGVILLFSYLKFCVDYPYMCTFNFRYILPILMLCAIGFAHLRERRAGLLAELYAISFSLLTILIYSQGLRP